MSVTPFVDYLSATQPNLTYLLFSTIIFLILSFCCSSRGPILRKKQVWASFLRDCTYLLHYTISLNCYLNFMLQLSVSDFIEEEVNRTRILAIIEFSICRFWSNLIRFWSNLNCIVERRAGLKK